MENKIKRIQIRSNNIAYGPEPLPMEEVEQVLTICDTGDVTFEAFNYANRFHVLKPDRYSNINIGLEAVEMIFELIHKWTELDLVVFATDVGSWEMGIIAENNQIQKYTGSLAGGLEVDGISLSNFMRTCIPIDNLFVFDEEEFLEEENEDETVHRTHRKDAELVVNEFLNLYREYGVVEYSKNCNELVVVVADTMVFYIKYDVTCKLMDYEGFEENHKRYLSDGFCGIDIEELTPNTILPKYRNDPFLYNLKEKLAFSGTWIRYGRFKGVNQYYLANGLYSQASYVITNYPDVKLQERLDAWKGEPYTIVVFEMKGIDGRISYAADAIKGKVHSFVLKFANNLLYNSYYGNKRLDGMGLSASNKYVDDDFVDNIFSHKRTRMVKRLQENLTYYSLPVQYFRDEIEIYNSVREHIDNAKSGKYDFIERISYSKPEYKWKTEEYVLKIIKKFYKDYGVIYQHRPFFLHSSFGGQMSYDIYISQLKIAIEYQGKQHFEPVDFFGGVDAFEKVRQRDEDKRKLSKENGIKLIYFNYWDEITPDLVCERIDNAIKDNNLV